MTCLMRVLNSAKWVSLTFWSNIADLAAAVEWWPAFVVQRVLGCAWLRLSSAPISMSRLYAYVTRLLSLASFHCTWQLGNCLDSLGVDGSHIELALVSISYQCSYVASWFSEHLNTCKVEFLKYACTVHKPQWLKPLKLKWRTEMTGWNGSQKLLTKTASQNYMGWMIKLLSQLVRFLRPFFLYT